MAKRSCIFLFLVTSAEAATTTQFYAVTKGYRYAQTNANGPTLQVAPQAPYRVRALLYSSSPTTASVKAPNNAMYNLTVSVDRLEFSKDYTVLNSMNNEWPPGNFTFTITSAADGTKNPAMNLSTDFYPAAPRISNFVEAQGIDSKQPFTVTWAPLGRPAQDFVYFRIELSGTLVFESPKIPGAVGALNGQSTSISIPANRLEEGKLYAATLTSWLRIDTETAAIVGALGQTAYTAETMFPMRTRFQNVDVRQYGFEKRVNYEQDIGVPVLRANPYEMIAFAHGAKTNAISGANYKGPSGTLRPLAADGNDFVSAQAFAASGSLEAPGIYEIALATTGNGNQTNRLNFVAANFPGALQIANIDAAQYVRPTSPFMLTWTSADGAASDLAQLSISEGSKKIMETPGVIGAAGAMNGSARSFVIPAGTLLAEKSYTATLRLMRPVATDSMSYPGALGVAGYSRVVRFPLKTASSAASPQPLLEMPRRLINQTELRFTSVRGEIYRIQNSTNLADWSAAQTVTGADGVTTWLSGATSAAAQFYRVLAGP